MRVKDDPTERKGETDTKVTEITDGITRVIEEEKEKSTATEAVEVIEAVAMTDEIKRNITAAIKIHTDDSMTPNYLRIRNNHIH